MDRVQAAKVFIAIVERGSMIAAASHLDMSRSMVTRYLAEIEDWAGARLLHRSTRRLSLTPTGETVLEHCQQLIKVANDIPLASADSDRLPSGLLRISCSDFAAQHILMPVLADYSKRYPDVTIELQQTNETVNLVEQRIDLAIRIASELDPNLIARKLGHCDSILCASPEYLKAHGTPTELTDLKQHDCLIYSYFGKHGLWNFERKGESYSIPVTGKLIANESGVLLTAARAGMGIAYQPTLAAQQFIESGELVQILPEHQPIELGIYGVYQSRMNMSRALRLLLDELVNRNFTS